MPFEKYLLSISNSNRLTVFGLRKLLSWLFGLWSHMVLMGTGKEKWILSWHDLWVNLGYSAIFGALDGEERGDSISEPWIPPWFMPTWAYQYFLNILYGSPVEHAALSFRDVLLFHLHWNFPEVQLRQKLHEAFLELSSQICAPLLWAFKVLALSGSVVTWTCAETRDQDSPASSFF